MRIRINKATDTSAWYNNRVGESFTVERFEQNRDPSQGIPEDVYWVRTGDAYNTLNYIRASDAEVAPEPELPAEVREAISNFIRRHNIRVHEYSVAKVPLDGCETKRVEELCAALAPLWPKPGYAWENWTDKALPVVSASGTAPASAEVQAAVERLNTRTADATLNYAFPAFLADIRTVLAALAEAQAILKSEQDFIVTLKAETHELREKLAEAQRDKERLNAILDELHAWVDSVDGYDGEPYDLRHRVCQAMKETRK